MPKKVHVQTTVNGAETEFLCEPRQSLLEGCREFLWRGFPAMVRASTLPILLSLMAIVLFGAVAASWRGRQISFDLIIERSGPKVARMLRVLAELCVLTFHLLIAYYGWNLMDRMGEETAVSILGEILAVRAGREGGPLRGAGQRIHAQVD